MSETSDKNKKETVSGAASSPAPDSAAAPDPAAAKRRNIILIGMPGVGKTTIAKRLTNAADMQFLDTDRVIEAECGKTIARLVEENGAEGFIALENRICAALAADNCVIATGGSVVYGEEAMRHLSEIGTVVYLKLAFPLLRKRLDSSLAERGVVLRSGQTFYDLYKERTPLYEAYADIVIDEHTCYPTQTAERVYRALSRNGFFCERNLPNKPRRILFAQHPESRDKQERENDRRTKRQNRS